MTNPLSAYMDALRSRNERIVHTYSEGREKWWIEDECRYAWTSTHDLWRGWLGREQRLLALLGSEEVVNELAKVIEESADTPCIIAERKCAEGVVQAIARILQHEGK